MTMSRDLFLAILAMDSYNRGYGEGVKDLGGIGSGLGNAFIGEDALTLLSQGVAQAAGFYALAYDVSGAGIAGLDDTVIAYRGTDKPDLSLNGDILNGWLAGGDLIGLGTGAQAPLSIEFYKSVVGTDADGRFTANPFTANITLTGHSLGGGLAAFVASLYGKSAAVFDNMPFELASSDVRARALINQMTGWGGVKDFLYGPDYNVPAINREGITGITVTVYLIPDLWLRSSACVGNYGGITVTVYLIPDLWLRSSACVGACANARTESRVEFCVFSNLSPYSRRCSTRKGQFVRKMIMKFFATRDRICLRLDVECHNFVSTT